MERIEITSSNLKSVGYDPATQTMEVEFHKGPIYRYKEVPLEVYDTLVRCDSAGAYFAMAVKGKYEFEKEKA